jgi:hypothetical protein
LFIERKVDNLNDFTYKSYKVSKDFSANIKNFQNFLLFGYKQKDFYENNNQKDFNLYITNLENQKKRNKSNSRRVERIKHRNKSTYDSTFKRNRKSSNDGKSV